MARARRPAVRRRPTGRGGSALRRVLVRSLLWTLAGALALSALLVVPWRWIPPPTTAFMLREALARRAEGAPPLRHRWVPWREIAPALKVAVVAAEDQKFPTHAGFDLQQIAQAVEERDERLRGASTITQQLAKNLYLWPGRSLLRKGLEAWFTVWLEATWPKRRILEVYLNVAEMGPGLYGVGAAAPAHFGVSPATLSREQACLLAAVLPSPRRMSAGNPSPYVRERAQEIEAVMERLGGTAWLRGI